MAQKHKMQIDINCDLGEDIFYNGQAVEEWIMPYISSASIACGRHSGNEQTMRKTIELAKMHQVAIGAHPGYDDRQNFGRQFVPMDASAFKNLIKSQLLLIQSIAYEMDAQVSHVKPHGALYNRLTVDTDLAKLFVQVLIEIDPGLAVYTLPVSALSEIAKQNGITVIREGFGDRLYLENGTLASRFEEKSIITNPDAVIQQCINLIVHRQVHTISGNYIPLEVDSICIHGDNINAFEIVKSLHGVLQSNGISLKPIVNV